jgi:ribonuclease P protein component
MNIDHRFRKSERLCSKRTIDSLFGGGNKSFSAFPLRVVFQMKERAEGEPPVAILISVSKRHFKRAVKRNRVKRQLREAYRLNKENLWEAMEKKHDGEGRPQQLAAAFLWLSDSLLPTDKVFQSMNALLHRMAECVNTAETNVNNPQP